jgi:hypothetical protein
MAARLARLAIRPSGSVRAAQQRPEWPGHRVRRDTRGGAAHAGGGEVQTCRGLRGEHRDEEGQPLNKERWPEAHCNGGSTVRAESGRCGGG